MAAAESNEVEMSKTSRVAMTACAVLLSAQAAFAGVVLDRKACEDAVYKVYNNCLVTSENIWQRLICDVAFQLDIMSCGRLPS